MKYTSFIFLLFSSSLFAQTMDTFLDPRDNRTYRTIEVGTATWFQENLRIETPHCFCKGRKKKQKNCQITNYYSNKELADVCPVGWHVASLTDWQSAIDVILKDQTIDKKTIKIDTIDNGSVIKLIDHLTLMGNKATILDFQPIGWVQGNRIQAKQNTTLWIYDEVSQDDRFHIHYGNTGYVQHAHAHNIDGPKRKRRRFSVRCVKDCQVNNLH